MLSLSIPLSLSLSLPLSHPSLYQTRDAPSNLPSALLALSPSSLYSLKTFPPPVTIFHNVHQLYRELFASFPRIILGQLAARFTTDNNLLSCVHTCAETTCINAQLFFSSILKIVRRLKWFFVYSRYFKDIIISYFQ